MNDKYVKIGNVVEPFGLKGALKIYPTTDFISDRYQIGKKAFLYNHKKNDLIPVEINNVMPKSPFLIVTFKEINTINVSETLTKHELIILKDDATLDEGYFFDADLLNLNVYTDNNVFIGKVKRVEEYGPYKTLRVKRDRKRDLLVPYIEPFIVETSLENHKIIIKPIEGML
jgi:16S rRNA processing protein RimM